MAENSSAHPQSRRRCYAFIGLGALGFHLASCLARAGFRLFVHDLDASRGESLRESLRKQLELELEKEEGRAGRAGRAGLADNVADNLRVCSSVEEAVEEADALITCLPTPEAARSVIEEAVGVLSAGSLWIEMSTNDPQVLRELADFAKGRGIETLAVPVTGGVHRAAAGEITLLIGGDKALWRAHGDAFDAMGGKQIWMGSLEQAAEIKAITNMLAFVHLAAAGEALALSQASGVDLGVAFEAIRHSSGNSFVFETEGKVILNGSYHIDFTMDLGLKDLGFVRALAERNGIPLSLASIAEGIFLRGKEEYGGGAQSPRIVRLLEERIGREFRAEGFPEVLPPG